MSGLPEKQIIPPDALYTSNEKMMNMKNSGYISYEHVFNDSKVRTLLFMSVMNILRRRVNPNSFFKIRAVLYYYW